MSIIKRIFQPKGKGKSWWAFVLIMGLTLVGSLIIFGSQYNSFVTKKNISFLPKIKEVPFREGLDLLGGTQLIYNADVSAVPAADRTNAVDGARDVIEKRVNVFGVSEPLVQINRTSAGDYRIIVELAGIKDVNEAIKKIGETPLLEFKEQNSNRRELTADETKTLENFNKDAAKKAEEVLGKLISNGDFGAMAAKYSDDANTKDKNGDMGWISDNTNPELAAIAKDIAIGQFNKDLKKTSSGYQFIKVEEKRVKKDKANQDEKEVKASHLLICYKGAERCDSTLSKEDAYAKIKKLKDEATAQNFKDLVKQNSTEPSAKDNFGELGWFGKGDMVEPFEKTVFDQKVGTISYVVETKFGYHIIFKQDERIINEYRIKSILVKTKTAEDLIGPQSEWKNTELTGRNLKRASVEFNPRDNSPEVSLEFDSEGAKMFEEVTQRNIGKPVAIFLDGEAISTPNVNEKITGGKAVISGKFDLAEAQVLSKRLNAGALPVPIDLISQQTIGASLGKASVDNSMKAAWIGLILVALFMIVYYRLPGLLSVFALGIYGVLVLAVFKLWPVTITLSGIAGFVLSIGIAVDANVLIFERMKEELRWGKAMSTAVKDGFDRAWPSIRDGNFTTIIVCLVLMMFSTSVIKGFAITLFLGIMISMFTAIVVTKNFLKLIPERWLEKHRWLIGSNLGKK